MKNVKKSGRLQLNRQTLRSLSESELEQAGGASGIGCISVKTIITNNPTAPSGYLPLCGTILVSRLCASTPLCNGNK